MMDQPFIYTILLSFFTWYMAM